MRSVYICAPYRGDIAANRRRAVALAALAVRLRLAPILPHVHDVAYLLAARDPAQADALALEAGLGQVAAVARSGGLLWVLRRDDGTLSAGCRGEVFRFAQVTGGSDRGLSLTWAGWRERFATAGMLTAWEAARTGELAMRGAA